MPLNVLTPANVSTSWPMTTSHAGGAELRKRHVTLKCLCLSALLPCPFVFVHSALAAVYVLSALSGDYCAAHCESIMYLILIIE